MARVKVFMTKSIIVARTITADHEVGIWDRDVTTLKMLEFWATANKHTMINVKDGKLIDVPKEEVAA